MTDTATNYAYQAGVLEIRLKCLATDLAKAGLIADKDIDKVNELCTKIVEDSRVKAREYARNY